MAGNRSKSKKPLGPYPNDEEVGQLRIRASRLPSYITRRIICRAGLTYRWRQVLHVADSYCRAREGVVRIGASAWACDTDIEAREARRIVCQLCATRWLDRVDAGGGRGYAASYQLYIPLRQLARAHRVDLAASGKSLREWLAALEIALDYKISSDQNELAEACVIWGVENDHRNPAAIWAEINAERRQRAQMQQYAERSTQMS